MLLMDGEAILDRLVSAVEKVRERLERATQALEQADVPYAVIGGNAVTLWVEKHGEGGGRNTPNIDLLVRRDALVAIEMALKSVEFAPDPANANLFRDGPNGSHRSRIRLLFAGERVREMELLPNPDIACSERIGAFQVLALPALVQTKLTAFRTVDHVHLRDMLDVKLIDETWKSRYPLELAERLQMLIDTPDG